MGLPSGPHQYLCVVCLKTFCIGLSNFAYLFHIIHNISNTCQSVAYLPITQQASPLPRQYLQTQDKQTAKSLSGKKNKYFLLGQKTGLQCLQTKQTATRLFETGKNVSNPKTFKYRDLSDRLQRWKHPITKVQQCLEKSLRLIDLHPFSV